MDFLKLTKDLLTVAEAIGMPGSSYAGIALKLIETIRSQTGMTDQQIIERAGATYDQNTKMLMEDLERLRNIESEPKKPVPAQPSGLPPSVAPAATTPQPEVSQRTVAEIEAHLARLKEKKKNAKDSAEILAIEKDISRTERNLEKAKEREASKQ